MGAHAEQYRSIPSVARGDFARGGFEVVRGENIR